jgi:hypothetical protein
VEEVQQEVDKLRSVTGVSFHVERRRLKEISRHRCKKFHVERRWAFET